MIRLDDLDYELPAERIAQVPVRPRDAARLLVLERASEALHELRFAALADEVGPHDLLVVNDTRVVPAKLRGRKASGGWAEALLLNRRPDGSWLALLRCRGRRLPGLELRFGELRAVVLAEQPGGAVSLRLEAPGGEPPAELLERSGEAPLPPYIRRKEPDAKDLEDYQSIFAQVPGAIAAPTASLHFTRELAARLPLASVTLHVGPGTFRPLRARSLDAHALEPERFEVPQATAAAIARTRAAGGRVIAVGTTVVRALETSGGTAGRGCTDLLIQPGHRFRVIDALITNFHLPKSTLLMLVSAFASREQIFAAYRHALAGDYRFFSYGDAMLIE